MKKFNTIVLCSLILFSATFLFSGCGDDNNGYIEVQSVEYSTTNSNKSFKSYIKFELNEPLVEVTEEEFRNGNGHKYGQEEYLKTYDTDINKDKSNLNELKVNDNYFYSPYRNEFYKTTIKNVYPAYVKIKIDNTILYIIDGTGEKYCVKADVFIINYFM